MRQVSGRRSSFVRLALVLATVSGMLTAACAGAAPQAKAQSVAATVELGGHRLAVAIAADPISRENGLMHRTALADEAGMLFVFPVRARHGFWMHNTPLPLSIAFIDDDGTIINLADMTPNSEQIHSAQQPVRYALEVNQGWFARRGVKAGQRATLNLPDGLVGR